MIIINTPVYHLHMYYLCFSWTQSLLKCVRPHYCKLKGFICLADVLCGTPHLLNKWDYLLHCDTDMNTGLVLTDALLSNRYIWGRICLPKKDISVICGNQLYWSLVVKLVVMAKCQWCCKKGPGWNDPMAAVVPRVKGFACYSLSFSRHNKNIKMEHFFLYILSRYFIWLHKWKGYLVISSDSIKWKGF